MNLSRWLGLLLCLLTPLMALDRDGDGLSDAQEATLGTPPDRAEEWHVVLDQAAESPARQAQPAYRAGLDITAVACAHVAEDRVLWRVTMNGPLELATSVLHLYIDADANPATGRQTEGPPQGTEYLLSVIAGEAVARSWTADGNPGQAVPLRFVHDGPTLWISADLPLERTGTGLHYRFYLLAQTYGNPAGSMTDQTPIVNVTDLAVRSGAKPMAITQHHENWQVKATFGLDVVRKTLADPDNIYVAPDELTLDGFEANLLNVRRYPELKAVREGAQASWRPLRAGHYHIGFLMYDDAADDRIAIGVNGESAGIAVANRSNNRYWIYWLARPRHLTPADQITLTAVGATGHHPVAGLLLMPKPPAPRDLSYTVDNFRWVAPVGTTGEVWLSWTTSLPCSSRFEYRVAGEPIQTVTERSYRMVHKARLRNLSSTATFEGRGVGTRPDGTAYYGPWVTFSAAGAARPPTVAGLHTVPLRIVNPLAVAATQWPVTGGVPFPRTVLGNADHLRLVQGSREIPIQVEETATWPDGSLKWVLITLLADVPAGQTATYDLQYGRNVRRSALEASPAASVWRPRTTVTLAGGDPVHLPAAQVVREQVGPLRTTTTRQVVVPEGLPVQIEERTEAYAGSPFTRLQYTLTLTGDREFVDLKALQLQFAESPAGDYQAALLDGGRVPLTADGLLTQRFDHEYSHGVNQPEGTPGRLVGNLFGPGCLLGIRHGWQNYPLGFSQQDGAVRLELLPAFEKGLYDRFPFETDGSHLYFHLQEGAYRLKRGMSKTWELGISQGSATDVAATGELFQHPLVLQAPNEWNCDSGAFYHVHPRDEARYAVYEQAIDRNIVALGEAREAQRDYGFINFGDWFGERKANWGNIEYDTQNALFLEFIRSGNLEAFTLGCEAEVHNRDVDTVHWSADPLEIGLVYTHQMGHVGGYYDRPVPGTKGFPKVGYAADHAWVEGHFSHYFLTGDERSRDTAKAIADFVNNRELSQAYDFSIIREPGWILILNAAALAATNDPYYLNASRLLVDRVLETQDLEPRPLPKYQAEIDDRPYQVGAWSRMLAPGHCVCEPRERGNASFMISVLLSGLAYYYDVTGEPAVKECIIRGAKSLVDEYYSEDAHGFRYTPCVHRAYVTGADPLMLEGIARAYRWTHDPRFVDPLTQGLARGPDVFEYGKTISYGKSFSVYYRNAPRMLSDYAATGLAMVDPATIDPTRFEPPAWLAKLAPEQRIVLQAEDFTAQGGGTAQIVTDRLQTWGSAVTKWDRDLGHWLEWTFDVPTPGRYEIWVRYASDAIRPARKIELDGRVPTLRFAALQFRQGFGYGTSPGQWIWRALPAAPGEAQRLDLTAGQHVLRFTNLGGGLALDCIVLVRK